MDIFQKIKTPQIIYLDQNQWIEIAKAVDRPDKHPKTYALFRQLILLAKQQDLIVPLSGMNIYETQKINDAPRRSQLAWVQATLSQGRVFQGRTPILRGQIAEFLCRSFLAIIAEVGLFDVEVSLATKIEFEHRDVDENDLRDLYSYTTAICHSDVIVGEKAAINRARQAHLEKRYPVKLLTSLDELPAVLRESG